MILDSELWGLGTLGGGGKNTIFCYITLCGNVFLEKWHENIQNISIILIHNNSKSAAIDDDDDNGIGLEA